MKFTEGCCIEKEMSFFVVFLLNKGIETYRLEEEDDYEERFMLWAFYAYYLTIIPRARMGCESIAHKAEGQMGYWLRAHEGKKNNCFSKIQLDGQKHRDKTTLAS